LQSTSICTVIAEGKPEDEADSFFQRELAGQSELDTDNNAGASSFDSLHM